MPRASACGSPGTRSPLHHLKWEDPGQWFHDAESQDNGENTERSSFKGHPRAAHAPPPTRRTQLGRRGWFLYCPPTPLRGVIQ